MNKGIRNIIIVCVLLLNIGCDQITKNVARNNIEYGEQISVIAEYLTLTKVENTGAFLSLGNDLPEIFRIIILNVLPSVVLIGMLIFILRKKQVAMNFAIPFAFIIGGGIGNLYDRILYGSVTDFLHMDFQLFRTGIFNMADVSIMIGVFWLMFTQLKTRQNNQLNNA